MLTTAALKDLMSENLTICTKFQSDQSLYKFTGANGLHLNKQNSRNCLEMLKKCLRPFKIHTDTQYFYKKNLFSCFYYGIFFL